MKYPAPNPAEQWDVIVVGAGPGGAAASKRCAEAGFRTLVLEKRAVGGRGSPAVRPTRPRRRRLLSKPAPTGPAGH